MSYEITANTGRCEALTVSDIPVYRCTSVATADRDGHAVCAAHSRARRICYYDSDDAGVLYGRTDATITRRAIGARENKGFEVKATN